MKSEPGGPPACSVLVPVLNEASHIQSAVRSMLSQRLDGQIEFLLIDGGSTDGTRAILASLAREDPRIRLLENPRGSTPVGLNIGLGHARGEWVARMDAHSEFPDDYLERGVQRLAAGDTTWVSGPQVPVGANPVSRAVALALRTSVGTGTTRRWGLNGLGATAEYELDSGVFCGVWPRDALLEAHGWDERWLRNQDSELASRFLAYGARLVCIPAMAAVYRPRSSLRRLWRQYLEYGEYREKTAVRHPHTVRPTNLLLPALTVAELCAIAGPPVLRRPARAGMCLYGAAIVAAGITIRGEAERREDAALVPVVLAVMHTGHGAGFWRGVFRNGPPFAAVASLLGLRWLATRFADPDRGVFSPSLSA